jgi:hypothetical protein
MNLQHISDLDYEKKVKTVMVNTPANMNKMNTPHLKSLSIELTHFIYPILHIEINESKGTAVLLLLFYNS